MNDIKDEILKNLRNYMQSSDKLYKDSDYTSSCVLYFKAFFAALDYLLLINGFGIPKDHSERFRLLQRKFPVLYKLLDKFFPIYQRTYSLSIDKEECIIVRDNVKDIIKKCKIPL